MAKIEIIMQLRGECQVWLRHYECANVCVYACTLDCWMYWCKYKLVHTYTYAQLCTPNFTHADTLPYLTIPSFIQSIFGVQWIQNSMRSSCLLEMNSLCIAHYIVCSIHIANLQARPSPAAVDDLQIFKLRFVREMNFKQRIRCISHTLKSVTRLE